MTHDFRQALVIVGCGAGAVVVLTAFARWLVWKMLQRRERQDRQEIRREVMREAHYGEGRLRHGKAD